LFHEIDLPEICQLVGAVITAPYKAMFEQFDKLENSNLQLSIVKALVSWYDIEKYLKNFSDFL